MYFPEAEGVADADRVERPLQTPTGGTEKVLLVDSGIAFLQKPFTAEGLARKVREVLDQ